MDLTDLSVALAKLTIKGKRHDLYADLAEALAEGEPPQKFFSTKAIRAKERKDVLGDLYELWASRLRDRSLADALKGTVPDNDILILESAQMSDTLVEGLRFLSRTIVSTQKMRDAVLGAIVLPMILLSMSLFMLCGFSFFMVPMMVKLIRPEAWPPLGKALYSLSSFIVTWGPWVLGSAIVLLFITARSMPRWHGTARTWIDNHFLPFKIYRSYIGSLFLVMLGGLMKARIQLNKSLDTLKSRSNGWLGWHIEEISHGILKHPGNPGKAFDTGVFDVHLTDRIVDFGARDKFELAIEKVGADVLERTTVRVERSAKILNYALVGFCGFLMMFMIAGVMLTMQQVDKEMKRNMYSRQK